MYIKICKTLAFTLILFILVEACEPIQHTSAVWYTDSLPNNIIDGSQPAIGPDGLEHKVLFCKQLSSGDLLYKAHFTNPYSETLTALIGVSLDNRVQGTIWGKYIVKFPPGLTEVTFNTSELGKEEQDKLFYTYLPSMITYDVDECSVYIFGFEEGSDFQVVFPVAIKKLSSRFELPKAAR